MTATTRARVALATTYYHPVHGGAETAARRLATFLARRGHAVQVFATLTDPALPRHDSVDGVPVLRIGRAAARRGSRKWLVIPAFERALWRARADYDVICVVDYRGIGLAALAAGARIHRPVVVQAQTEGVLSGSHLPALARAASWPVRRLYRAADAFACISRGIEREAAAQGIARERIHYLPNTVDTARFHPPAAGERAALRAQLGWPGDTTLGIFVGRLSREKGVADLLEAWRRSTAPGVLMIVGPDMTGHPWDEGPAARALVERDDRLRDRVRFVGPSDDPAPLYRAADFAVVPSHWESFGISAAEAMASGLPVVASAVGGLTDFIVDGSNGLLVPARNPDALAAAIERVAASAELRSQLGGPARTAMAVFDESVVLERFGALLDSLAGRA